MWLSILTQHSALIEITTQGLSCCHGKRVQNSYNPLPQESGKIQLLAIGLSFALVSYCILPAALGSGL